MVDSKRSLRLFVDVGLHQRVDDIRGHLGFGAAVMDFDDAGILG